MNTFNLPATWVNRPINIALVGCGGSGSACLTELYQMSYLLNSISNGQVYFNVTAFDGDEVSPTNVGRQSFYPQDINRNKAEVLIERINVFGGLNWTAMARNFDPKKDISLSSYSSKYDLIITCVDTAKCRAEIGQFGKAHSAETLWLDLGNSDFEGQVVMGHLSQKVLGDRLPNVYDLYPELESIVDKDEDSCSHSQALAKQSYSVNKKVVLEATGILWLLLREGKINRHGSFVNLKDGTVFPLAIDAVNWSMLGYVEDNKNNEKV